MVLWCIIPGIAQLPSFFLSLLQENCCWDRDEQQQFLRLVIYAAELKNGSFLHLCLPASQSVSTTTVTIQKQISTVRGEETTAFYEYPSLHLLCVTSLTGISLPGGLLCGKGPGGPGVQQVQCE